MLKDKKMVFASSFALAMTLIFTPSLVRTNAVARLNNSKNDTKLVSANKEEIVLWENDGTHGIVEWDDEYKFALEGTDEEGECLVSFSTSDWDIIKNKTFCLDINSTNPFIRVTTGSLSTVWTGGYIATDSKYLTNNKDGTFTLTISFDGDIIVDAIDAEHLLFTGTNYTPLRLYTPGERLVPVKKKFWENPGEPAPSWGGYYRFSSVEASTGEECAAFDDEIWDIVKNGTFYLVYKPVTDFYNIRITTGWWTGHWPYGGDSSINPGDPLITDNLDGTFTLQIKLSEGVEPIAHLIDEQHLLFTGDNYLPLYLHYNVMEPGPGPTPGPTDDVFWENSEPTPIIVDWNGIYRFGLDGMDGNNECIATFPQNEWDVIKGDTFYLDFLGSDWFQLRITTGWWSTTWTGNDIIPGDERITENEDGTFTIEINFTGDPIVDLLDGQHLLFTGGGYTPLRIYQKTDAPTPPEPAPTIDTFWENDGTHGETDWDSEYCFGLEGTDSDGVCLVTFTDTIWNKIKNETFYMDFEAYENPTLHVTTFSREAAWPYGDRCIDLSDPRISKNEDETYTLEINLHDGVLDVVNKIDEDHLLFSGQDYKPLRIYQPFPCQVINKKLESEAVKNNGYLSIDKEDATKGEIVTIVVNPNNGYVLKEDSLIVKDEDGEMYELTELDENTYTFVMPKIKVAVNARFEAVIHTVTFNLLGHGEEIEPVEVMDGSTIIRPANPASDGYIFQNWYKEEACVNVWDFKLDTVTSDVTLYAKWTIVTSKEIVIDSSPNKTQYTLGEDLDLSGAKINVTTASGEIVSISITKDMISGYDKNKIGTQVITVTYNGLTTTFVVNVINNGLSNAGIIGIVIGSIVGAGLIIVIATFSLKKKKARANN